MHNVEFDINKVAIVQHYLNERLEFIEVYDFLEIGNDNELSFVGIMIDEDGIEIDVLINVTPDNYVYVETEDDEINIKGVFKDINIWSL